MKNFILGCGLVALLVLGTAPMAFAQDDDDDFPVSVPEPATLTMLGLGLAGLAGYSVYKKRQ